MHEALSITWLFDAPKELALVYSTLYYSFAKILTRYCHGDIVFLVFGFQILEPAQKSWYALPACTAGTHLGPFDLHGFPKFPERKCVLLRASSCDSLVQQRNLSKIAKMVLSLRFWDILRISGCRISQIVEHVPSFLLDQFAHESLPKLRNPHAAQHILATCVFLGQLVCVPFGSAVDLWIPNDMQSDVIAWLWRTAFKIRAISAHYMLNSASCAIPVFLKSSNSRPFDANPAIWFLSKRRDGNRKYQLE